MILRDHGEKALLFSWKRKEKKNNFCQDCENIQGRMPEPPMAMSSWVKEKLRQCLSIIKKKMHGWRKGEVSCSVTNGWRTPVHFQGLLCCRAQEARQIRMTGVIQQPHSKTSNTRTSYRTRHCSPCTPWRPLCESLTVHLLLPSSYGAAPLLYGYWQMKKSRLREEVRSPNFTWLPCPLLSCIGPLLWCVPHIQPCANKPRNS